MSPTQGIPIRNVALGRCQRQDKGPTSALILFISCHTATAGEALANLVKRVMIIGDSGVWVFGAFPVTTESEDHLQSFLQDSCWRLHADLGTG
jgi:hypothetical protein